MANTIDAPIEILRARLNLQRELVARAKLLSSEPEILEMAVRTVAENLPGFSCEYAEKNKAGEVVLFYVSSSFEGRPPGPRLNQAVPLEDGASGMLSLVGNASAGPWEGHEQEVLQESAELIALILRAARSNARWKNSEEIFKQFSENIDSIFWMNDPLHNEMIYVSPSYDRIWGHSRKELKENPRSFVDAIHPEDQEMVVKSFAQHFRGPFEKTYRVKRPDGSIRWIKDRSFPIKNEAGEIYRVVGIAEDVTILREAQERLESTQAQVVSNAKFAALGEMASSIAHEINNPLAVIHGISVQLQEISRAQAGDQLFLDSLFTVEKMSKRISLIIKGLRTFSRQTDWDPKIPTDLSVILLETLAICDAKIYADGIELVRQIPSGEIFVECRSAEICQVMLNLLRNAIDAVEGAAHKKIVIRLYRSKEGMAVVFVEDSGAGVEESLRESIFQPFFTTKEVGRGTGLGLSISKTIVEAHGGRIYLDGSAGRTRFVVELPAVKQEGL